MSGPAAPPGPRVTTLELFFDLVFVFTITQLSAVLAHDLAWAGVGHVATMLGLIWFMYGGYAWLTNAIDVGDPRNRQLLLAAMCAYFVLALAVPGAFHGSGLAFGLGYLAVVAVHTLLFVLSGPGATRRGILRLAPSNVGGAALVVAGGALGGSAQTALWAVAAVASWALPRVIGNQDFDVAPAHFVERHGLVILIAIGESVVAIGTGAAGLAVDLELVLVAVLGLVLSAGLWWTYFGGDDARAEEALAALPAARRARASLDAFGYAHFALLLGIVVAAVGVERAVEHAYDPLERAAALALAGGVALFFAADVWFRGLLRLGRSLPRLAGAPVALATIPLGTEVAAVAQVGALAVVAAVASKVAIAWPARSARRRGAQVQAP